MGILYIILIIVGVSAQSVLKKAYNNKSGGSGVFTFAAISSSAACLFFLVKSGFSFEFSPEIIPYALLFALAYVLASVFNFLAIQCGPLSLTSLALSFSLLIPTFYGLIFDGDKISAWLIVGILFLVASMILINLGKGETKITLKWAIYAVIALVANGVCSTVQPVQTAIFESRYDEVFMIIALACVSVSLFGLAFCFERRETLPSLKGGWHFMVVCGLANGAVNLFVMLASVLVDKSVMFPLISAGGIVLTWLISVFLYKEKLALRQNVGMVLGVAAIVFLNL